MADTIQQEGDPSPQKNAGQRRGNRRKSSLFARGEPMVWLTGGSLIICLVMILGLLTLVLTNGLGTFWPKSIERIEMTDGSVLMGEIHKEDEWVPEWGAFQRVPAPLLESVRRTYFEIPEKPGPQLPAALTGLHIPEQKADASKALEAAIEARLESASNGAEARAELEAFWAFPSIPTDEAAFSAEARAAFDAWVAAQPEDKRAEAREQLAAYWKFYTKVNNGFQPVSREVEARRRMYRTGNYRLTNNHFNWVADYEISPGGETRPEWAMIVERLQWGRFYGVPTAFRIQSTDVDGRPIDEFETVAEGPEATWNKFTEVHDEVVERFEEIKDLEKEDLGDIANQFEELRLDIKRAEIDNDAEAERLAERIQEVQGKRLADLEAELASARQALEAARSSGASPAEIAAAEQAVRDAEWAVNQGKAQEGGTLRDQETRLKEQILKLRQQNERYRMDFLVTSQEEPTELIVGEIVRAYPANRLGTGEKFGHYLSRWGEYLTDDPREANSEGGVWPAIFGTIIMTLIMSIMVVPFGVLAALYLREYAKQGTLVSIVRIAVNNLAGVPSIVFGVFGLGFFCYVIGAGIDDLFFAEKLPTPTFGTGGILWASLTLALLTLPVVIVATEEALAAVPNSMREGSYACGASKWQTIRRIVLPRAAPGIMTGMILAVARGAGEVAPLMLVGAVKLAPELPIDGTAPFIHAERSFMHLGFHIYDLGFQSQNSEAAKPMVFTTTLLLIAIVVTLNILAIWVRAKLRKAHSA